MPGKDGCASGRRKREYYKVTVGRETFEVDVRYTNLKAIGR